MDSEQFERFMKIYEEYVACMKNFTSTISLVVSSLAHNIDETDKNVVELAELSARNMEVIVKRVDKLEGKILL